MIYTQSDGNCHNNNPVNLSKLFSVDAVLEQNVRAFLERAMLIYVVFYEFKLVLSQDKKRLLALDSLGESAEGKLEYRPNIPENHYDIKMDLEKLVRDFQSQNDDFSFDLEAFKKGLQKGDYKSGKGVLQNLNKLNIPSEYFTDLGYPLKKKKFTSNKFVLKIFDRNPGLGNKLVVFYLRERNHAENNYSSEFIEIRIPNKKRIVNKKSFPNFAKMVVEHLGKRPEYSDRIKRVREEMQVESVCGAGNEQMGALDVKPLERKLIYLFHADYKNYEWKSIEDQKQICIRSGDEVGFTLEDMRSIEDNFQTNEFVIAKLGNESGKFDYYGNFGLEKSTEKEVAFKINIEN